MVIGLQIRKLHRGAESAPPPLAMPYYPVGLRNRLSYELKFNDYNRVINSSNTNATYKITDISLEYDIVTQPELARSIRSEYDKMVLLYDRVIQHSQIPVNKSDTKWNWSLTRLVNH